VLADACTALAHGEGAAREASETARKTFEEGARGDALPHILVAGGRINLIAALTSSGLAASNGEARRKVSEGAVRVNDVPVGDPQSDIVLDGAEAKLSLGKKRHVILVPA
jgi:tyrosyl-tRNA synthetase